MNPTQTALRAVRDKLSEGRARLAELGLVESWSDEQKADYDRIQGERPGLERRENALTLSLAADDAPVDVPDHVDVTPEQRELREHLSNVDMVDYVGAMSTGLRGRAAELNAALNIPESDEGGICIPHRLVDHRIEQRQSEARDITPAPSGNNVTGITIDRISPMTFAPSVAGRLGVDIVTYPSGGIAIPRITTAVTAGAVAKNTDSPETAGAITSTPVTYRRIAAGIARAIEDVANVGDRAGFSDMLMQHTAVVMANELDDQMLNGNGTAPNIKGLFAALGNAPTAPTKVVDFDAFLAEFAGGIDGLWATKLMEVAVLCGVETYQLAAAAFRDREKNFEQGGDTVGGSIDSNSETIADYLETRTAGFSTNKRMPAKASDIEQAILCRKGMMMMPSRPRTAVWPTYGYFSILDQYTLARKGQTRYVVSAMMGSEVVVVQPDAYKRVSFKVS